MNLIVDIGNTATKVAIFHEEQLLRTEALYSDVGIQHFIEKNSFEKSIMASVNNKASNKLLHYFKPDLIFTSSTPVSIKNTYKTPQTLGVDRLAAVIGAKALFPQKNCLVIDIGTCITYDLITAQGEYPGGMITPGPELKTKSLNNFTSSLPLVNIEDTTKAYGDTTASSILTGIINGTVAEIEGIITNYKKTYPELEVIICGGWAKLFESKIKASIFVEPNLVLIGLNAVLKNNA